MTDTKKYVLGTAYEGYASEVIVDLPKANIRSGLVVAKNSSGAPVVVGEGEPYGISGQNTFRVSTPVQTNGLKVCARLARLAESQEPAIGGKVYCNADGEILTADGDGAIELAATFASNKVVGIDLSDNTEVDAVLLDFPGGL